MSNSLITCKDIKRSLEIKNTEINRLQQENADLHTKWEQEKLTGSMLRAKLFESEDKRDELLKKIEELEKYAELGRLVLTTNISIICGKPFAQGECTNICGEYNFCQKRAELLAGENHY